MLKINGKTYKTPSLDFNTLCELENMGVSIADFGKKPMFAIRAFVSLAMNGDTEKAGNEIAEHLIKGGSLEDISNEFNKSLEESGFFQALGERAEKENAESQTPKSKAKASEK